jgi:hypothetical protein
LSSPEDIRAGIRVEILQPDYVAGEIGVILGREELVEGQLSNRWLIQVIGEDVVVSLTPDEFRIISQFNS